MNIISIDIPWKSEKKERRALAFADKNRNIRIMRASDDDELLELVQGKAEPRSFILLDVPIDGCDCLNGKHFRPVDKALTRQTLPALPASKAGSRGRNLKSLLKRDKKRFRVYEIYPYATYKFLAYLKDRQLLQRLNLDRFDNLLDEGFRIYWPPKYKRERQREEYLRSIRYLYYLLTDPSLGLSFSPPLRYPDFSFTLGELSELCDEYDACLGAIVGIYHANKSSYVWLAGDSDSGSILLLADRWLSERMGKEVKVSDLHGKLIDHKLTTRLINGRGKLYDADRGQVIATVTYQIWRKPATEHTQEKWWGGFALEHMIGECSRCIIELEDGRKGTCFIQVRTAQCVPGFATFYHYNLRGINALTEQKELRL